MAYVPPGYGEDGYDEGGYGGYDRPLDTGAAVPDQGPEYESDDNGVADLTVHFMTSGMIIKPLTLDNRQDVGKDDWARVRVTKEAAELIQDGVINYEPVELRADGDMFWRGFTTTDSVSIGHTDGSVQIYDPLKVLENGMVDFEVTRTSLKDVVDRIWGEYVNDPRGVFTGLFIAGGDRVEGQFGKGAFGTEIKELDGYNNALREFVPFLNGDGNFDFRGESPREALQEVADVFGINMFTLPNGALGFGNRSVMEKQHTAARDKSAWRIRDFNVPNNGVPFGMVLVKGVTPIVKSGGFSNEDNNIVDITNRFMERADMANTWASASVVGYDGPVTVMEYTQTEDPETLQRIATNILIQQYQSDNNGSVSLDVLATELGSEALSQVKLGDTLTTIENQECGIYGGTFRIQGLQHNYDPKMGWFLDLDVIPIPDFEVETNTMQMNTLNGEETTKSPMTTISEFTSSPTPYAIDFLTQ